MIPAALIDAIADEGRAVAAIAAELGGTVAIEPEQLLKRDIKLSQAGNWSPNRHCRLVAGSDGWIAVNLARQDDEDAVAAWLECATDLAAWDAVVDLARDRPVAELLERAVLFGLPVAAVGETAIAPPREDARENASPMRLSDITVIDLSALWAGPLCGGLLAETGMAVTKVDGPARPDPTSDATPELDRRLNGRKRRISMALTDPRLRDAIASADILITSARPHALARLGLSPEILFSRNQRLIWVAITAHGFHGIPAMRVGFGDDCAAAGGLVEWTDGEPRFLGDALADPLTGLRAARLALDAVAQGQSGLIDVALAPTAAVFAHRAGLR